MTNAVSRDMTVPMPTPQTKAVSAVSETRTAFADSMQQATQSNVENKNASAQNTPAKDTEKVRDAYGKTGANGKEQIKQVQSDEKADDKVTYEDVKEAAGKAAEEITQDIADELNVSEEEVEAAMEALGFLFSDLVQNGNMAALVSEITGADAVDALTDETAFLQIDGLTDQVQEVLGQLGEEFLLDDADMEQVMQQLSQVEEPVEEGAVIADGAAAEKEAVYEVVEDIAPATEMPKGQIAAEAETDEQAEPAQTVENVTAPTAQNVQVQTEADAEDSSASEHKSKDRREKVQNADMPQQGEAPRFEQNVNAPTLEPVFTEDMGRMSRAQDIINQIADHVRLHRSEQITAMEIELNPASLGNVHLQVASKDGVVSAQLTAQNEAVKAALESQLLELKERLEEQGIKVTEVEVTVASHQFEQNLEQQARQDQERAMQQQGHKNSRRILNLDQIDEDGINPEDGIELSDAERLQADMMRLGGNKLNFRV